VKFHIGDKVKLGSTRIGTITDVGTVLIQVKTSEVTCAWSARGKSFGFFADATPRLNGEKMSVHGGLVIMVDNGPKRTVRVQLAQQGQLVVQRRGRAMRTWPVSSPPPRSDGDQARRDLHLQRAHASEPGGVAVAHLQNRYHLAPGIKTRRQPR